MSTSRHACSVGFLSTMSGLLDFISVCSYWHVTQDSHLPTLIHSFLLMILLFFFANCEVNVSTNFVPSFIVFSLSEFWAVCILLSNCFLVLPADSAHWPGDPMFVDIGVERVVLDCYGETYSFNLEIHTAQPCQRASHAIAMSLGNQPCNGSLFQLSLMLSDSTRFVLIFSWQSGGSIPFFSCRATRFKSGSAVHLR